MAKKYPVVQDEAYEEMAATFQLLEVSRLNEVLKQGKVPDKARRKICERYFFEAGAFLDSGWLNAEGKRVFPTLCFAERPVDPEEGLGAIAKLYTPSELFAFHEHLHGTTAAYFEELGEQVDDVKHDCL